MATKAQARTRARRRPSATALAAEKTAAGGKLAEGWLAAALDYLARRRGPALLADCPLPELYRAAQHNVAALTIGQFHDGMRQLHEHQQIYLHPWTGPLYELPEPALALLVGHEIAYYASLRAEGDSGVAPIPEPDAPARALAGALGSRCR